MGCVMVCEMVWFVIFDMQVVVEIGFGIGMIFVVILNIGLLFEWLEMYELNVVFCGCLWDCFLGVVVYNLFVQEMVNVGCVGLDVVIFGVFILFMFDEL